MKKLYIIYQDTSIDFYAYLSTIDSHETYEGTIELDISDINSFMYDISEVNPKLIDYIDFSEYLELIPIKNWGN